MSSNAWKKFNENAEDVDNLIDIYKGLVTVYNETGGGEPDGAGVLFKSAIVLLVSNWEAYIEDITSEALEHIVRESKNSSGIPKEIKKKIRSAILAEKNEIEMWNLADDGWRDYLLKRLSHYKSERNKNFNSPKSTKTIEFIRDNLGIDDISTYWIPDKNHPEDIKKELDKFIEVRGSIAHRGKIQVTIDLAYVKKHLKLIRYIASITGGKISTHVKRITGKALW